MTSNQYLKEPLEPRSRIFEFSLVIVIVGILLIVGVNYYIKPIPESQKSIISLHAGIFSRMVVNIAAFARSSNASEFTLNGHTIYLNKHNYPANTDAKRSPSVNNQTSIECQQLWNAFFNAAPSSALGNAEHVEKTRYIITYHPPTICRYQLARKQEGTYYFDYDIRTGAVTLSDPY